ncbi:hypothetical protein WJS89_10730 [Sphingomicrobium sp. XHP0235]|uniref:hypothetical protein n=1 Tax=Sphingomicrobium aquimarinum TaxID=3133971 RepID=UPI0031FEBB05
MTGHARLALPMFLLPLLVILGARIATHSDWAATHSSLAALMFAWVVADAIGLASLAKARCAKGVQRFRSLVGAIALAGPVVLLGGSAPVREALLEMPALLALFAGAGILWVGWSGRIFAQAYRAERSMETAFAAILPPKLVRAGSRELATMRIALFSWGGAQDVPAGSIGHDYHRALAPLLWVLLGLQVIELGVVHLLLMLWNETVAWVVFALTMVGIGWFVAMIKAIRLYPVLLGADGVRVRSGMLVDFMVPLDAIAIVEATFEKAVLDEKETLNLAILSAPNVALTLKRALVTEGVFGSERRVERVALHLDDPAHFLAELERLRG